MSRLEEKMKEPFFIWGREIEVDIIFECYGNDTIVEKQIVTYEDLKKNSEKYFSKAYDVIVEYLKINYSEFLEAGEVTNIFKYVVPKEIFIKQYTEDRNSFGIISHFKFDRENGLVVRFADGKVKRIGPEQIM